jgi:hypothetical protein
MHVVDSNLRLSPAGVSSLWVTRFFYWEDLQPVILLLPYNVHINYLSICCKSRFECVGGGQG